MSYSILYDSLMVKLPKSGLFLTLDKSGCSNVRDAHGGKRSRSWNFWSPLGTKPYKMQDLVEYIDELRDSAKRSSEAWIQQYPETSCSPYEDKYFGYHIGVAKYGKSCYDTTFNMFRNHYIKRNFVDFNKIAAAFNVYVEVPWYGIPESKQEYYKPERKPVKNEEELLQTIEYFSLNYVGCSSYVGVDIWESKTSNDILRVVAPELIPIKRIPRVKELIEVDGFYTIMYEKDYFKKKTKRFITFNRLRPELKFKCEADAIRKLKRLKIEDDDRFSIKFLDYKTTILI